MIVLTVTKIDTGAQEYIQMPSFPALLDWINNQGMGDSQNRVYEALMTWEIAEAFNVRMTLKCL